VREADLLAYEVYALADPRTGAIRYVGWSYDAAQRFKDHLKCARNGRGRTRSANWIRSLLRIDLEPLQVIVETGIGEWAEAERRWIRYYRRIGADLTNHTDGGGGVPGMKHSPETIEKLRRREVSAETRARMSAAAKARSTPEYRAHLAALRTGTHPSSETRAKLAAAHRGRPKSAEHRARLSAANKGQVPWNKPR
jgi:hypothetical protein